MAWRVWRVYIHLLIGGLGVGPAVEIMDIVVSDFLSIAEYLLAVHAQSLVVQAEMFGFQSFGSAHKHALHSHTQTDKSSFRGAAYCMSASQLNNLSAAFGKDKIELCVSYVAYTEGSLAVDYQGSFLQLCRGQNWQARSCPADEDRW